MEAKTKKIIFGVVAGVALLGLGYYFLVKPKVQTSGDSLVEEAADRAKAEAEHAANMKKNAEELKKNEERLAAMPPEKRVAEEKKATGGRG
jgi:Tfp pilus assembly protein PilO